MEAIINKYISEELVADPDVLPISNDLSLMDTYILDSLKFLSLVTFLEDQFDIAVEDTELTRDNFETIDVICQYVRKKQEARVA